tara:strand:+ start:2867 stop:3889 length:1023 start_codon:yes stop_codon:yes gene_type:complete
VERFYNLVELLLKENRVQVLDVGASGGIGKTFIPIGTQTDVVGFEPNLDEYTKLLKRQSTDKNSWHSLNYLPLALGKKEINRPFYILNAEDLSSFLHPNINLLSENNPSADLTNWQIKTTAMLDTVPLDEVQVHTGHPINLADFIKLDTQGSELEIMQSGNKHVLNSLVGIEIEVGFLEIYKNQPIFSDVDLFLRDRGFDLYRLDRYYGPRFGHSAIQIKWANALYLKNPKFITKDQYEEGKIRKLIIIALLNGFVDTALRILYRHSNFFTEDEKDKLSILINDVFCFSSNSFKWRLGILKDAFNILISPSVPNRFKLAKKTLRAYGPKAINWNIEPPGL